MYEHANEPRQHLYLNTLQFDSILSTDSILLLLAVLCEQHPVVAGPCKLTKLILFGLKPLQEVRDCGWCATVRQKHLSI